MDTEEKTDLLTSWEERSVREYRKLIGSELIVNKEYKFTHRKETCTQNNDLPNFCCGAGHEGCTFLTLPAGTVLKIEEYHRDKILDQLSYFVIQIEKHGRFMIHKARLKIEVSQEIFSFKE